MSTHILKAGEQDQNKRLDVFLTQKLGESIPSRSFVKKLIDHQCVTLRQKPLKAHYKMHEADEIHVDIPADLLPDQGLKPENVPLDIFYEDDYLIVVNKPIGMTVHPARGLHSGTLVNALLAHAKSLSGLNDDPLRPGIVHRLDKDTSGLILVAKDNITHARLAKQFQRREVKKQYLALVKGSVPFDQGKIDVPIGKDSRRFDKKAVSFSDGSRDALTFYKVLKRTSACTLVSLFPKTGRTHQLRVHMRHLGYPILGDEKYGDKNSFPRLALHAQSICFTHPHAKKRVEFSSVPPAEFLNKIR